MPKVSDQHRAAQRERIHRAAVTCIERTGLGALTMGDIIRESGLSAGAIYGYYPGKQELTRAVAEAVLGGRREEMRELLESDPVPPPAEVIERLASGIPTALVLQFWASAIADGSVEEIARSMLAQVQQLLGPYLERWMQSQGHPQAEARTTAELLLPAVIGLMQGYILQHEINAGVTLEKYAAAIDALLNGALATAQGT